MIAFTCLGIAVAVLIGLPALFIALDWAAGKFVNWSNSRRLRVDFGPNKSRGWDDARP